MVREGIEFNRCHSNGKPMFHLKKNRERLKATKQLIGTKMYPRCHLVVCCISSLQGERRGEEGRGGEWRGGEEKRGEERR